MEDPFSQIQSHNEKPKLSYKLYRENKFFHVNSFALAGIHGLSDLELARPLFSYLNFVKVSRYFDRSVIEIYSNRTVMTMHTPI